MTHNAAMAYKNTTIQTAAPGELTLMLYEGAIKFCNIGLVAIEKKDIAKAHTNIVKAQKIIAELRATLNPKYPVSKDFDLVYDYIYSKLIEANIKKDSESLEEALIRIREMRDTWKEVMQLTKTKS